MSIRWVSDDARPYLITPGHVRPSRPHPGSGSLALDGLAGSPFILTRILSIPPSPEKLPGAATTYRPPFHLPGAATTYRPPFHPPGRNNISEGSYTPSQRPLNKRRKNNPAWERSRGSKAQSSFGPESSAMSEASGHRSGGRVRLLPPAQRTGGIKKEDIKTGTYRNDMFPLMSIFFFLPRLFNGLCRRGVCPSRRFFLPRLFNGLCRRGICPSRRFFLPRLFNGLCRRGVCPSRRLLLQFHHYFSSGALVLVVPHARRVEHSLACDRHR